MCVVYKWYLSKFTSVNIWVHTFLGQGKQEISWFTSPWKQSCERVKNLSKMHLFAFLWANYAHIVNHCSSADTQEVIKPL